MINQEQEQNQASAAATEPVKTRGETDEVIIANILENVPGWSDAVQAPEHVSISKLSGLSNACYRVALNGDVTLPPNC